MKSQNIDNMTQNDRNVQQGCGKKFLDGEEYYCTGEPGFTCPECKTTQSKTSVHIGMIENWFDLILIIGLDFVIMILGIWTLPELPGKIQFLFALGIMCGSIYFMMKIVDFLIHKFKPQNTHNMKSHLRSNMNTEKEVKE